MDEITTLVGRLVLPATITTVLVLVVVNVAKGRERPVREAVRTAQSLVASGGVEGGHLDEASQVLDFWFVTHGPPQELRA